MKKNLLYYLGFSHFLGIGPTKFSALLKNLLSVKKAYKADKKTLAKIIGEKTAVRFVEFRKDFDPEKTREKIHQKEITIVTQESSQYPEPLKNIPDPPICLYIKGDINKIDFHKDLLFAIVGTRKPSPYGQQITKYFSNQLAKAGFIIVSGLAMGIDTIAHKGAVNNCQKTIAVLGCGVDIIYPAINSSLYHQIIKNKGLIISEFPPGKTVQKGLFIARNRLISGLAKGVLVIEGDKNSGTLITARHAANQGKDVFAPPVPLTSKLSNAPTILLKQGAKLTTSIKDILEEFNVEITPKQKEQSSLSLTPEEQLVFDLLTQSNQPANELSLKANIPINKTLSILSQLEIKTIIEKDSQGKYKINLSALNFKNKLTN